MIIKKFTTAESSARYESWDEENSPSLDKIYLVELDPEYKELRDAFVSKYLNYKNRYKMGIELDYQLSLWFYQFIKSRSWFSMRLASDENFWRYIAMVVVPDVIADRFPGLDKRHFYSKGTRIYPYTLFWYTYLSKQETIEKTEQLLASERFSTDTIVSLVERTGGNGTFVDLYREIMYYFSKFDAPENIDYIKLFRSVMKLCPELRLLIQIYVTAVIAHLLIN